MNDFVTRSLVYVSSEFEDYSLIVDYQALGVHAICHSTDIYKQPCVYCQLSDPEQDQYDAIEQSPGFGLEDWSMEEEASDVPSESICCPNPIVAEVLLSPDDESICTESISIDR